MNFTKLQVREETLPKNGYLENAQKELLVNLRINFLQHFSGSESKNFLIYILHLDTNNFKYFL